MSAKTDAPGKTDSTWDLEGINDWVPLAEGSAGDGAFGVEGILVHELDDLSYFDGLIFKLEHDECATLGIGERAGTTDLALLVQRADELAVLRSGLGDDRVVGVVLIGHCEIFHVIHASVQRVRERDVQHMGREGAALVVPLWH